MNQYELGYAHGFNDNKSSPGKKQFPNNPEYMEGFKDGDWARVHRPSDESWDDVGPFLD